MRTGTVRNLRDARHFSAACERETGVVADPAWVLDGGGRVVAHKGVLLGGYVLEFDDGVLTNSLIPQGGGVSLPADRVSIAAFWLHHGLSDRLRGKVSRQLVRDVRRSRKRHVVVVTPRQSPSALLEYGLPERLYAGVSGHPDVAWIQIRLGSPSSLRRAGLTRMFRAVTGAATATTDLAATAAVVNK